METGNDVGFKKAIATVIGGNGLLFALVLASVGIQGCNMDDAAPSAVETESPAAELDVAAQTAAAFQSGASSISIGGGCRLYGIVADAGSRARGQAYISCDEKKANLQVGLQLIRFNPDGSYTNINARTVRCRDVWWCGTGNIYLPDPSGTQKFRTVAINWAKSGTRAAYVHDTEHF